MASPISWSTLVRNELWDGDRIVTDVRDNGDSGFIEIRLKTPPEITWWKAVLIFDQNGRYFGEIWTQDEHHESHPARLPAAPDFLNGWRIELAKAKLFGVHTGMYSLPILALNGGSIQGKLITFTWMKDA